MRRAVLATTPAAALFGGGSLTMPVMTVPVAVAASLPTAPAFAAESVAPTFAGPESAPVEASYYGAEFAGRATASGEIFDPELLTAAHREFPLGSLVLVTDAESGRSVTVRVNDRGPFHGDRAIDLSHAAARRIGLDVAGIGEVKLRLLAGAPLPG